MTVSDLHSSMTSKEFLRWVVYRRDNMSDAEITHFMLAQLCSIVVNALSSKGKKSKPEDFYPKRSSNQVMDPAEIQGKFLALGKKFGNK